LIYGIPSLEYLNKRLFVLAKRIISGVLQVIQGHVVPALSCIWIEGQALGAVSLTVNQDVIVNDF
jgi:hypothetical protein